MGLTLGGVVRSAIDTVLTLRGVKRGSVAPLLQAQGGDKERNDIVYTLPRLSYDFKLL